MEDGQPGEEGIEGYEWTCPLCELKPTRVESDRRETELVLQAHSQTEIDDDHRGLGQIPETLDMGNLEAYIEPVSGASDDD